MAAIDEASEASGKPRELASAPPAA